MNAKDGRAKQYGATLIVFIPNGTFRLVVGEFVRAKARVLRPDQTMTQVDANFQMLKFFTIWPSSTSEREFCLVY